jgi:type II secretory pathway pseudopilin PulG
MGDVALMNKKTKNLGPSTGGFTLVEMLLALGISGLTIILMFTFLGDLQKVFRKANAKQNTQLHFDEIIELLIRDIRKGKGLIVGSYWMPPQCYPFVTIFWKDFTPGNYNFDVGSIGTNCFSSYQVTDTHANSLGHRSFDIIVDGTVTPPATIRWSTQCEPKSSKGFTANDNLNIWDCANGNLCTSSERPVIQRIDQNNRTTVWPKGLTYSGGTAESNRRENTLAMAICANILSTQVPALDVSVYAGYWDSKRKVQSIWTTLPFQLKNAAGGQIQ